jgi:radical SAM-linked protein
LAEGGGGAVGEGQFLYRLHFSKVGDLRFHGQLEISQSLIRAVRRSGLPAVYSSGFHPHMKLSFEEALPLGMESLAERAVLTLRRRLDPDHVGAVLNGQMPPGLRVERVEALKRRPERPESICVTYRVAGLPADLAERLAHVWDCQRSEPISKETKRGRASAPLGDVLLDLRRADECTVEMDVLERKNLCFRPASILRHLLPEHFESLHEIRVCKISVSPWDDNSVRPVLAPDAVQGRCSPCPPRSL